MRIGVDARTLTEEFPSGVTIYAYHCIQAMVQAAPGEQFLLFVSGYQQTIVDRPLIQAVLEHPNVTLKHLRWPNKLFHGLALIGLAPRIDKFLGNIDVLFVPNVHLLPTSNDCPVVLTMHDLSHELFPECLSWRRRLWHRAVCIQKLVRRAQHIIAVSNNTKHDIVKLYHVAANRVTTIYPGISTTVQNSNAETALSLPKRYALILATLEPRKNILATLQAFQIYKQHYPNSELELVIIGGAGWKSRLVMRLLHDQPYFHYFGYVSDTQKMQALKAARLLLYPSLYEGFGLPPLEALCYTVPTIASLAGAIPEIMQQSAYYVHPYSPAELAEAIHMIDQDEALREQLLHESKAVLGRYDWTKTARATLSVLRRATLSSIGT